MKKWLFYTIGLLFCFVLHAENVELTVYNQNFALVKDQRTFQLKQGLNKIDFTDVASLIEPTSVHFISLTFPEACIILEQNYEYDLVNSSKILSKYIDNSIQVITKDERSYEGKLLSYDSNNLIIASQGQLNMLTRTDNIGQIIFAELPEGLITRPTLVWEIDNKKAGEHLTEVSYLTRGVNWHCEYVVVLDKDDKNIDLDAWVSIDNRSGTSYEQANLKLIAGDVKRAEEKVKGFLDEYGLKSQGMSGSQFKEKAFFEYHLYSLSRKTTLKENQTKQVSLLNAFGVPIAKEFIFDPSSGKFEYQYYSENAETIKTNVRVELEFVNSEKNNLGMPLPEGKIKVYKQDEDGSLQFIGEDSIKHTPKNEKIRLYIGDAFDVVGERTRTDFKQEYHSIQETYEITLRNHKENSATVKVLEKMWRHASWKILDSSLDWDKKDASTIEFKVNLPPDSEKKIMYTVKYWW